jgi:hypothetical protein
MKLEGKQFLYSDGEIWTVGKQTDDGLTVPTYSATNEKGDSCVAPDFILKILVDDSKKAIRGMKSLY